MSEFKPITDPFQVAQFDFSGRQPIKATETFPALFIAKEDTKSSTIFFWWELNMNPSGSILLSCAPHWAHPDTNVLSKNSQIEIERQNCLPWRDHWMQGCFHIDDKALKKNSNYFLRVQHDEFSWSFRIFRSITGMDMEFEHKHCGCYYHFNSKNSLMQMNNDERRNGFVKFLKNQKKMKSVLFVGDHSMIPLFAASLDVAEKIFIFQENQLFSASLQSFVDTNGLKDKIKIFNYLEDVETPITDLICDLNFEGAVNPIQNITEFFKILRTIDVKKINIHPRQIIVNAMPVHFLHLHKIRWPLQSSCEGFAHESFDSILESASTIADENVEPFSLWEYPCFALGLPSCAFSFSTNEQVSTNTITALKIEDFSKNCNGIAFWLEWKLDDDVIISSGPKTPIRPNELVNWKFDRQMVHLIPYKHVMAGTLKGIKIQFAFDQNFENISLSFAYHH